MISLEFLAALIDIGDLDRLPARDLALVRRLNAHDHLEQGRFTGTIRADDADDRAMRYDKVQILDQQTIAECLADILELHDR